MKALILAAGRGTRVQPLTYDTPKPMIPILNKPVMELLVRLLAQNGVRQIMVNTSYLADDIESYFRDGSNFGVEMAYSFEGRLVDGRLLDEPVGSAGALRKIQDHSNFFDETVVVLCGDAIIDIDLQKVLDFHRAKGALATIALAEAERNQISNYGVVVTDEAGKILEFQEKPSATEAKSNTINAGIYIFEPEVIERIPPGTTYDIGSELFPDLVSEGAPFFGTKIPFKWLDIGKVSDYYQVMQMALTGGISQLPLPGTEIAPGVHAGLNVRINPQRCEIVPPVYLGGSATVEDGTRIVGPTLIGAGCVVQTNAQIIKSIVLPYSRISGQASLNEVIVCGNYCVNAAGITLNIADSAIEWVITDARSPQKSLNSEQREFLRILQQAEDMQRDSKVSYG